MTEKAEGLLGVDQERSTARTEAPASKPFPVWLESFVEESNRIEGIPHFWRSEVSAHERFLALDEISVAALQDFVKSVAGTVLRDEPGMDVRVGNHFPAPGGPGIRRALEGLCIAINQRESLTPFEAHVRYEQLHPFLDGNGRSGRAVWLWMMQRNGFLQRAKTLGFLHAFYYQTLDAAK